MIYWNTCFICGINTWPKKPQQPPPQNKTKPQTKPVTEHIKAFHLLPLGWVKDPKDAQAFSFQKENTPATASIHILLGFFLFFFPTFKCNPTAWEIFKKWACFCDPSVQSRGNDGFLQYYLNTNHN